MIYLTALGTTTSTMVLQGMEMRVWQQLATYCHALQECARFGLQGGSDEHTAMVQARIVYARFGCPQYTDWEGTV